MASRRVQMTVLQRQLGEGRTSLRDAQRAVARSRKRLRVDTAATRAASVEMRKLSSAHQTFERTGGKRGNRATAAQLAAAPKKVDEAKAAATATKRALSEAIRQVRVWALEVKRRERSAALEQKYHRGVKAKENVRHRQIHRRLDTELLNKGILPGFAMPLPPWPGPRNYPRADMEFVAHRVCDWMNVHLTEAAKILGGVSYVYGYPESLEVDGRLLFKLPDEMEIGTLVASVGDILRPMQCTLTPILEQEHHGEGKVSSLYYHELFFQPALAIYSVKHGFKSPGDRSRVLPGGVIETEFDGNWTTESHDHSLQTLEAIYNDLLESEAAEDGEYEMGLLELRFHWSPVHERPERSRAAPDRSACGEQAARREA